ncbi:NAD(P)-dependent oxidoreductase [Bacteroides fragilis]|nr:NAD(P)-dependent oxidoreductase [Bacteroides fragilis]MCY6347008.1 NAD(P)-dependent oxidoreductase [Bacteroides fragilis]
MKILLTGATGFLGSHIAEALLANDVNLMITKRSMSSLNNCTSFIDHVQVINSDNPIWISQACSFSPDIIIHSAWTGVLSGNRDDWPVQLSNIDFMNSLLYIAEKSNVSKFIALGSQAEYGDFDGIVSENAGLFPVNSYGYVKSMVSRMVGSFCDLRGIDWYWLRVFPYTESGSQTNG